MQGETGQSGRAGLNRNRGVVPETTRVLTWASIRGEAITCAAEGERDDGAADPAGTGFEWYRHVRIPPDEPPPPPAPPQPSEEDLDLDRDIEYAFETEEPMSARPPAGDIE